jgi:hypothetical protein
MVSTTAKTTPKSAVPGVDGSGIAGLLDRLLAA